MGQSADEPLKPRLVLDTGALIALERDDPRAWEHLAVAAQRGYLVVVPILVVMEAQRGARNQQRLNQILKWIDQELPLAPEIGRQVAGLRHRSGVDSDTDVVVVLEALAVPGSRILTSDPDDMFSVIEAAGAHGRIPIQRV